MSSDLRGHYKKGYGQPHGKISFDIENFCDTLANFPGLDIKKWSIKKEWTDFSKLYFSSSRPKAKYIRGAYDYFEKNKTYNYCTQK